MFGVGDRIVDPDTGLFDAPSCVISYDNLVDADGNAPLSTNQLTFLGKSVNLNTTGPITTFPFDCNIDNYSQFYECTTYFPI